MEEKMEDSFFHIKENYEKFKKKYSNFHHQNQSTEIIATEDIFINQKEEIKKIKKRRLEFKVLRESYKEKTNLKYLTKKEQNFSSYNTFNTVSSSNKSENKFKNKENGRDNKYYYQIKKSNSSNDKILKAKKNKIYHKNLKIIKLKLSNINNNKKINQDIDDIGKEIIINNDNENMNIKNIEKSESEIDFLSLSNTEYFEKCESQIIRVYDDENNEYEDNNLPIINEKWQNLDEYLIKNNVIDLSKQFNFNKNVLRTKNYIDYNNKGVEINIHLKLYGQSTFYIFTRCYVDDYDETNIDKINNYEDIRKSKTENINNYYERINNNIFSKYSTVIKIFKNKNSKKAFASFGTFYKSKKSGHLHYKTFLQRQLVDFLHQDKNYYYLENDLCEFDIIIIDLGYENLETKINLNNKDNKERSNNIKSNFYLPINKKAKLVFCGKGNSSLITDLKIRSFSKYVDDEKDRVELLLSGEKKSCDCCLLI